MIRDLLDNDTAKLRPLSAQVRNALMKAEQLLESAVEQVREGNVPAAIELMREAAQSLAIAAAATNGDLDREQIESAIKHIKETARLLGKDLRPESQGA